MDSEAIVKLNVGGMYFSTSLSTLGKYPDSMLGAMFSDTNHILSKCEDGSYFIDRDGTHFRHILNFLRSSGSYSTMNFSEREREELKSEANFYGLDEAMFPSAIQSASKEFGAYAYNARTKDYLDVTLKTNEEGIWVGDSTNWENSFVLICKSCNIGLLYNNYTIKNLGKTLPMSDSQACVLSCKFCN